MIHVLAGSADDVGSFLEAAKTGESLLWRVPKKSRIGDPVLIYLWGLGFATRGVIASEPHKNEQGNYDANIGNIAPLLGLLGTVWGMIGAFSAIALDSSQVKGITMAYYVSMAMVTTAGGLIVAIPAMSAYYFLRGRVIRIVAVVEAQASEFVELIAEHGRQ